MAKNLSRFGSTKEDFNKTYESIDDVIASEKRDRADEAATRLMTPPSRTDIKTHMDRINKGRPGVPDNAGTKKKAK